MSGDESLEEIIAACFRARERGEPIDSAELIARHPELAAEIEEFLAADEELRGIRGSSTVARGGIEAIVEPPRTLGGFELLEEIGRGGMGAVFRARQASLGRIVAVKVLLKGALASEEDLERFAREARAAAALDHPNIVTVLETGVESGWRYYAMRHVEGRSLTERLPALEADPGGAARLLVTLARAVHHAHTRGVLHRDLKPGNIIIDDRGEPHILDFGLSRILSETRGLTRSGATVGTPAYMAPEQAAGVREDIGPPADVYSLGVILYEAITGKPPFRGTSDVETLHRILTEEAPPPSAFRPVPRDLETICIQCLEKEPRRRYATAADLADDLRRFLEGKPVLARRAGPVRKAMLWAKRKPAAASLAALLVLGLAGLLAGIALHLRTVSRHSRELEWSLYALRMHQAFDAAENSRMERVAELLRPYEAGSGLGDLRGFEWFHLKHMFEQSTEPVPTKVLPASLRFDPNEAALIAQEKSRLETIDMVTGLGTPGDLGLSMPEEPSVLLVTPDGRSAFGAIGQDLHLWHPPNRSSVASSRGHSRGLTSMALSPDSKSIATGGDDGVAVLWDAESFEPRARFEGHGGAVMAVAISPGGDLLATSATDGTLRLWRTEDGTEAARTAWDGGFAESACFSPDGLQIALGGTNGHIEILDAATLRRAWTFRGHLKPVISLAFSRDGTRLASGCRGRTLRVWSVAEPGAVRAAGSHSDVVWLSGFLPGGTTLLTASEDFVVKAWDVNSGRARGELGESASLAFEVVEGCRGTLSGNGERAAIAFPDGVVKVWKLLAGATSLEKGEEQSLRMPAGRGGALSLSDDGKLLALTAAAEADRRSAEIWSVDPARLVASFTISIHSPDATFSPDGRLVAFAGTSSTVSVRSIPAGIDLDLRHSGVPEIDACAFSRDGSLLATGGSDSRIRLWRLVPRASPARGELLATLEGHSESVTALQFFHDGKRLASASDDGSVRLWALRETREGLAAMEAAVLDVEGNLKSLRVSPDGDVLAACGGKLGVKGDVAVFYASRPRGAGSRSPRVSRAGPRSRSGAAGP